MPPRVLAIANQKGGVGKTTTALNLGHGLAEMGASVLLVDMDPQSSLSICLGKKPQALKRSIYDSLVQTDARRRISEVTLPTGLPLLSIAPSTIQLASAEIELYSEFSRELVLKRALQEETSAHDFVLIDCPPSLALLTINALAAADEVIIPIATDFLSLRGAGLLVQTISRVQEVLNLNLRIAGVLVTLFDKRTRHANEVLSEIRRNFGHMVFQSIVPHTVRAKESPVTGQSVLSYRPDSPVAQAYRHLAREINKQ